MKKWIPILCYCLALANCLQAQPYRVLDDSSGFGMTNVYLLPDKGYTLQQIVQDSSLPFAQANTLLAKGIQACWIKTTIKNPKPYDVAYAVWAYPMFSNTLYFLNPSTNQWDSIKGGHLHNNVTNSFTYMPCTFRAGQATTFYCKISTEKFKQLNYQLSIRLSFEKLAITKSNAQEKGFIWLLTISIIIAFFLYNLYLYFMFKDASYIYYLLMVFGGFWYITANYFYCGLFTNFGPLQVTLLANGSYNYLPFDRMVMQLATVIILNAFLFFAKSYLQTKQQMPVWHKLLTYTTWGMNLMLLGIYVPESFGFIGVYDSIPILTNMVCIAVLLMLLAVGLAGLRQKNKQAKYYLLAQGLPLIILISMVLLLFINPTYNFTLKYLPSVAIITQTITFAIALVAGVNLLKEELHQKKLQSELMSSQLALEQERTQRLEQKVEHDKKEIASAQQIKLLMKELHHRVKNNLQIVSSLLSLQSFRIKDKAAVEAVKEGQYRIEAMSLIHQRLYTTDNITEVNIQEYITDLTESLMQAYGFTKNAFDLQIQVTNQLINVDKAMPLSLIINELLTNSFKYAFNKEIRPSLLVHLSNNNGEMKLIIKDNGKGIDLNNWQQNTGSYGKELVQTFTKQLNGVIEVSNEQGTMFIIRFPL